MGFYRKSDVCEMTTYSEAAIRRLVKAGTFPKPIRLTARRTVWRQDEVDAWISEKMGAA